MGSIDKLTVTEQSEAFKKEGDKVIVAIANEDLSDDSDEEPSFPYEYRGKHHQPAVGPDLRSATKPEKQKDETELKDEELDELDRRAMKANADIKKKETTKKS